jgi:hypothetical protein
METKDYIRSFSLGQIWSSPGAGGGPTEARHYFWDENQLAIMQDL